MCLWLSLQGLSLVTCQSPRYSFLKVCFLSSALVFLFSPSLSILLLFFLYVSCKSYIVSLLGCPFAAASGVPCGKERRCSLESQENKNIRWVLVSLRSQECPSATHSGSEYILAVAMYVPMCYLFIPSPILCQCGCVWMSMWMCVCVCVCVCVWVGVCVRLYEYVHGYGYVCMCLAIETSNAYLAPYSKGCLLANLTFPWFSLSSPVVSLLHKGKREKKRMLDVDVDVWCCFFLFLFVSCSRPEAVLCGEIKKPPLNSVHLHPNNKQMQCSVKERKHSPSLMAGFTFSIVELVVWVFV